MVETDPIIEEINKLCEYTPLKEEDIQNALLIRDLLKEVARPVVELTGAGLCFVWPRLEMVFEDGLILYFRYETDRIFSWKPVEIGGGFEEGQFTLDLIDKVRDELRVLS